MDMIELVIGFLILDNSSMSFEVTGGDKGDYRIDLLLS